MTARLPRISFDAASNIERRASVAIQILDELRNQVPMESFNDDDWFEYVVETGELIRNYSGKTWRRVDFIRVPEGHAVVKGMTAKHLMLWRKV